MMEDYLEVFFKMLYWVSLFAIIMFIIKVDWIILSFVETIMAVGAIGGMFYLGDIMKSMAKEVAGKKVKKK